MKTKINQGKKSKIYINEEIVHVHGLELNIVTGQIIPKWSVEAMKSESDSQKAIFIDTYKLMLKLVYKSKIYRIAKTLLKNKKFEALILPDLKTIIKLQ